MNIYFCTPPEKKDHGVKKTIDDMQVDNILLSFFYLQILNEGLENWLSSSHQNQQSQ